ncbi:lipoprotein [Pasteurella multocida]|nr:lipoprotein [Pasteurella multocida]MCL7785913.1 lipoprotein [Pasteurella multocida]MCL7795382.1 lipoprotein [Pasteurella multocida]MCL7818118.1 lipoprotein [Pasteurella multocida]MDG2540955.1 lipoprotein [Pasteurella multocida]MEB3458089.1 lipoprotein [Pasteurella multocida]
MKKYIIFILMSLIVSGCAVGGSVNAGGSSSGVGVGIGIGTGVRF